MTAEQADMTARHPIRVVALRTGLKPDVLRVWERRYGVVEPRRSDGGQRLYSDADVERLALLHRATAAGRGISQVAHLSSAELARLVAEDDAGRQHSPVGDGGRAIVAEHLEAAWLAATAMAPARLEAALRHAYFSLGGERLLDGVLAPLLERVGQGWETGRLTPAHEHAASAVVRRLLDVMLESLRPGEGAPVIVIATPAGDRHEFGALLAATAAAAAGWRVVYLGPDVPAEDLVRAVRETGARVLGLSVVYARQLPRVARDVAEVARAFEGRVPLVVGGRAGPLLAPSLDGTGELVRDLPAFRPFLARHA